MITTPIETVSTMVRIAHRLAIAFALLGTLPLVSDAQQAPLGRTTVTLVASTTVAPSQRTAVVRRAQRTPQNVVFVDKNATPEDLAGALALVQALRLQHGDALRFDFRAKPEIVRTRPTWPQSAYRAWLIEQLVRLRTAPPAALGDLGVVSAVKVTIPAARGTITSSGGTKP